MKRIENECVDCGLPCLGSTCPYRNVVRYYCDKCGEEAYPLYHYEGKEVCVECILKDLDIVEGSDEW